MIQEMPIDVWANVARFLSQTDRVVAFRALWPILPKQRTEHETLLQFLEIASGDDRERTWDAGAWPDFPFWPHTTQERLEEMGFPTDAVVRALVAGGGDLDVALHCLLRGSHVVPAPPPPAFFHEW